MFLGHTDPQHLYGTLVLTLNGFGETLKLELLILLGKIDKLDSLGMCRVFDVCMGRV